jgi:hypothetical protein
MLAELRVITPEIAAELLKKNTKNRPPNRKRIDEMAADMKEGRWKVNGDTICFSNTRLIDGQKRLMACVKSGTQFVTLVVEGLDDEVFDTKDIGQRRTTGDTLAVLGEQNAKELAATLGHIERYFIGKVEVNKTFNNAEIVDLFAKYPDAGLSVTKAHWKPQLMPRSILAACHYLFSQKDQEMADNFVEQLKSGKNLQENTGLYLLRERLLRNTLNKKSKLENYYIYAITIKAWNSMRKNEVKKCLKWCEEGEGREAFPIVE